MAREEPPRRRVCDRFRVRERVGSGGFATVWRAVDEESERDVAVKFPRLDGDATNDAEAVRPRFDRAHRALSSFEGGIIPTSLVRFVDARREPPRCIVTEFVSGPDLADRVAQPDVSPGVDAAWTFGVPIARALGFLHANGYVYLDCKPENVLVRADSDQPVLVDFNTAEPLERDEHTLFYQDEYKAPEQVPDVDGDGPSGPWSDVYGVGKLLVFLLTGETMTTAETPPGGVNVREYDPDLSSGVASVVERATRADPDRRYGDCCPLVTALYEAAGRDPTRAAITDRRTAVTCPIRPGDTVGRVSETGDLPTLSVADPDRYVSPVHFTVARDDAGWMIRDASLNGTFVEAGSEWLFALSERGYEHLASEGHPRTDDGRPPERVRIEDATRVALVDPSYPVTLRFDPDPDVDS